MSEPSAMRRWRQVGEEEAQERRASGRQGDLWWRRLARVGHIPKIRDIGSMYTRTCDHSHNVKMASSSEKRHKRGRRDGGGPVVVCWCLVVRRLGRRRRTDGLAERGNPGTVARWEPGGALPPVTRQPPTRATYVGASSYPSSTWVPGTLGISSTTSST